MSKYMGFIIAMLLSVALVFEASTIVYASEPTINFAVSSASGKPGDTVNITISISGNTLGISSLGIALTYDREKLELGSPISNQSNSNLPLDDYY
ncbi:MAG: hypothetical protein LBT59_25180, partial [Clostridiales bacterium]|nr:hypothetical protein [Clostridiales bacterium]